MGVPAIQVMILHVPPRLRRQALLDRSSQVRSETAAA